MESVDFLPTQRSSFTTYQVHGIEAEQKAIPTLTQASLFLPCDFQSNPLPCKLPRAHRIRAAILRLPKGIVTLRPEQPFLYVLLDFRLGPDWSAV